MFHYSSYWGSWSRELQARDKESRWFVEVDLTPIRGHKNWKEVGEVRVRRHFTARARGDLLVYWPPEEVLKRVEDNLWPEVIDYLLTEDILSQIDWDKYEEFNNGGCPLDLCRKEV